MKATTGAPPPITVLLAEDHGVIRAALSAYLRTFADLQVVAECSDGEEAFRLALLERPRVCVLDISMPRMTGLEVARRLRDTAPATAVVLLSVHRTPEFVRTALEEGVLGYVVKDAPSEELVTAVRAAARGKPFISSLIDVSSQRPALRGEINRAALPPRERDVLRMLARGLSSKDAANELALTLSTVNWYRAAIMERLQIKTVAGLVKYALQHGLASFDD